MNLHNDDVLINITEDSVGCSVHKLLSRGIIDSSNCLQIKSLFKMQRI